MRRMRLKTAMIAIAALAFVLWMGLGLRRRAWRFEALAHQHGREANRLENLWMETVPTPPGEPDTLMEQVHWHDSVANEYRVAAARPWMPFEPEPRQVACECGYHVARRARAPK